jgi:hypothetical protein
MFLETEHECDEQLNFLTKYHVDKKLRSKADDTQVMLGKKTNFYNPNLK